MENYVIKRNGKYKPFESHEITDAIEKGFKSVSIAVDKSVFESIIIHNVPRRQVLNLLRKFWITSATE